MQSSNPLIDAHWDRNQGLNTFNNYLTLADLESNAEYKLICVNIVDSVPKLQIYKGASLYGESVLSDIPSAVISIYTDSNEPRIPGIAVACGSQVLVYRNTKPYFKFSLPLLEIGDDYASVESDVWRQKFDATQLVHLLRELSIEHGFANLSTPSQKLLAMSAQERDDFLKTPGHVQIKKQATITNMTKLAKSVDGEKVVECLIVTTESCDLYILDPETFSNIEQKKIPGVTSHIEAHGVYMVDYFIVLCTRQGSVYKLARGVNEALCLTNLSALAVGLALDYNRFLTVNMDSTFQSYTLKGSKEWSIVLNGVPTAIHLFPAHISESTYIIPCNAMKKDSLEGITYIYKGTELLYNLHIQEPIQAFTYGTYGYGEQGFIFNTTGGGLSIKLLKRTAHFNMSEKCAMLGTSLQHNIKLMVPKKSRIFVEQTLRERDQCKEIYGWFQKTWQGMKVLTNESYLNALKNAAIVEDHSLKLTAQVVGLGPRLKMTVQLQNLSSKKILTNISVSFLYDVDVYSFDQSYLNLPMMVPNYEYKLETFLVCMLNVSSSVAVIVSDRERVALSAVINMPPANVPAT